MQEYFQFIANNDPDDDIKRDAGYKSSDISGGLIGRYTKSENNLHLTLDELDADYFRNNIQLKTPEKEKPKGKPKASQERLRKAYWFFYEKLENAIKNNSSFGTKFELLSKVYKIFNFFCTQLSIFTR